MAHDAFISYSHADKLAADAACASLEAIGIRCWIAPRDIQPGAEWGEAIVEALDQSPVLVLIFSSHSNDSRQVRREVEHVVSRGSLIVPVRIDDIEPTKSMAYFMAGVHWLDALTPPLEQHLQRLATTIKAFLQTSRENVAGEPSAAASPLLAERPGDKSEPRPAPSEAGSPTAIPKSPSAAPVGEIAHPGPVSQPRRSRRSWLFLVPALAVLAGGGGWLSYSRLTTSSPMKPNAPGQTPFNTVTTAAAPAAPQLSPEQYLKSGNDAYGRKDYSASLYWYRKAADQGNSEAEIFIGALYQKGQGVSQDYKEAMRWYRKSADHGNKRSFVDLGRVYRNGWGVAVDYTEAVRWYQKGADEGDPEAENELGSAYQSGQGVPRDYAQALQWYEKAADQGNASAINNVGWIYQNGLGVPQDYSQALIWYRKAADKGLAVAQNNIGTIYNNGWGVPKDYVEAMRWYRRSADQGYSGAQYNVGFLYRNGEGVPQDFVEAMRWYREAADQGNPTAQNTVGYLLQSGLGVTVDNAEAMRWYLKAADQGYTPAEGNIGWLYQNGLGVPKDYAEAMRWYRKAADQGNAVSQLSVAILYADGLGVPRDLDEAKKWAQMSARGGYENAKKWLSLHE